MSKKLQQREYEAELIKVLDGDTIDCYIDLGFNIKIKKRIRYMGIDTWESRTRDLEEKKKGLSAKARNKELLEAGKFKLISFGTGKFGRVLGEVFVSPDYVGQNITEQINNPDSNNITTLGNPEIEDIRRAHAPANTVIPHSKPSLSGVI